MPLNDRRVISILLEESELIEERCKGYREELIQVISDVIICEREHRISGTNIQQKINDKCNATATFLVNQQNKN